MTHKELGSAGRDGATGDRTPPRHYLTGRSLAALVAGPAIVGALAFTIWPTELSPDSQRPGRSVPPGAQAGGLLGVPFGPAPASRTARMTPVDRRARLGPAISVPRSVPTGPATAEPAPRSETEKALAGRLDALRRELKRKELELAALRAAKNPVLGTLEARTRQSIAQAEKVIALTGLDADTLVPDTDPERWSGLATAAAGLGVDRFDAKASALVKQLDRWRRLQEVLRHLPLIAPLDHYRKSSDFGKRLHPITGRSSKHNGTDFAYYKGAPVLATAAGTVVFAGRRGGFGNLVEIDHGMGIRTRYAHLQEVLVEKGAKVAFRERIALLGASGRATGPHVHYEILVKGRPVDPLKFVTAGKYAFKPVPEDEVIAAKASAEPGDESDVDIAPKPRAAASMADRPDTADRSRRPQEAGTGREIAALRGAAKVKARPRPRMARKTRSRRRAKR